MLSRVSIPGHMHKLAEGAPCGHNCSCCERHALNTSCSRMSRSTAQFAGEQLDQQFYNIGACSCRRSIHIQTLLPGSLCRSWPGCGRALHQHMASHETSRKAPHAVPAWQVCYRLSCTPTLLQACAQPSWPTCSGKLPTSRRRWRSSSRSSMQWTSTCVAALRRGPSCCCAAMSCAMPCGTSVTGATRRASSSCSVSGGVQACADSSAGVAVQQEAPGAAGPGAAADVKWVAVPRGGQHIPASWHQPVSRPWS